MRLRHWPVSMPAFAAAAATVQPREGGYESLVQFGLMRQKISIPLKKGVMNTRSRAAGMLTAQPVALSN